MMGSKDATTAEMPAKMVACLFCEKDIIRHMIKDHIARFHLGYVPHRCHECGFICVSSKEMFHHAITTGHHAELNEAKNEYAERIMELFYHDCINAGEEVEMDNTQSDQVEAVRGTETSLTRNDSPPAAVGDGEGASEFNAPTGGVPTCVVISQQVQSSAEALHHDVPAANPDANEEEKPYSNKCQLCDAIVPHGEKKEHVNREHMNATLTCVVAGCTYDTTANYYWASRRLRMHMKHRHGGYKALTDDEKAALRQRQKDKRDEAERMFHKCFNETTGKERVKRSALDNDQASSDDGGEEGGRSQPRRVKSQE